MGDNFPNIANPGQENTYGGPRGDTGERFYFSSGFEGPPLFGGAVLDNAESGPRVRATEPSKGGIMASGHQCPTGLQPVAGLPSNVCRSPAGHTVAVNYVLRTGDGISESQAGDVLTAEGLDNDGVRDLANNSNLSLVAISTKAIDLTNARLPRLYLAET